MTGQRLFRVQDREGRGPWRPGFSMGWIDPDKDDALCPPMTWEFPNWRAAVDKAAARGLAHFGCCVSGIQGVHRWFTPVELTRLRAFGFHLVDATSLTPICEGRSQILAASVQPLAWLPVIEWELAQ